MLLLALSCAEERLEFGVALGERGTWVGDVDGDGVAEVVRSEGDVWRVVALSDASKTTLRLPTEIDLPFAEDQWGLVDVDQDGRLDLLSRGGDWYRGTEGGFDPGQSVAMDLHWGTVECGSGKSSRVSGYYMVDVDGDADLDRLWTSDECGVTGTTGWSVQYWEGAAWSDHHVWNREQLSSKLTGRTMSSGSGQVACSGGVRDVVVRDLTGDGWLDAVFKQGCGADYWSVFAGGPEGFVEALWWEAPNEASSLVWVNEGSGSADLLVDGDQLRRGALNSFHDAIPVRGDLGCASAVSGAALAEGWLVVTEDACESAVGEDHYRVVPVSW